MSPVKRKVAKKKKSQAPIAKPDLSILLMLVTEDGECIYYLRKNDVPLNPVEHKCIQGLEIATSSDHEFMHFVQSVLKAATSAPGAETAPYCGWKPRPNPHLLSGAELQTLGETVLHPAFSVACFARWERLGGDVSAPSGLCPCSSVLSPCSSPTAEHVIQSLSQREQLRFIVGFVDEDDD